MSSLGLISPGSQDAAAPPRILHTSLAMRSFLAPLLMRKAGPASPPFTRQNQSSAGAAEPLGASSSSQAPPGLAVPALGPEVPASVLAAQPRAQTAAVAPVEDVTRSARPAGPHRFRDDWDEVLWGGARRTELRPILFPSHFLAFLAPPPR